ncbi:MAG TPA: DUF4287 domain-containing protein [Polyangiaceae bacterium]|nr:DUF4287 domain-containing protein [Polyangiaceae bacterium]
MATKPASKKTSVPAAKVTGPASYFPSIEKNYGKPIAAWKKVIRSRYPAKHMEIVNWLKTEHGMGHGHANALVGHTLAEDSM